MWVEPEPEQTALYFFFPPSIHLDKYIFTLTDDFIYPPDRFGVEFVYHKAIKDPAAYSISLTLNSIKS